jgi:hypothetical protein
MLPTKTTRDGVLVDILRKISKATSWSVLKYRKAHGWEEVSNMHEALWQNHMPEVDRLGPSLEQHCTV